MNNIISKPYEGILLIDKDAGFSSHDVVAKVRKALKIKQVGHAGTLDPLATGLLVILVGRYTKLSNYITSGKKTYEAQIYLGSSTTTDDSEGSVLETSSADFITKTQVEETIYKFLGASLQVPPIYSAISVSGERAYKKARKNELFELPAREICIYEIKLLDFKLPLISVEISCSKGTYIRSFARDLGKALGVPAHLYELRRSWSGDYCVDKALPQFSIDKQDLSQLMLSEILCLKKLSIEYEQALRLRQGQRVKLNAPFESNETFLAYFLDDPVALVTIENGIMVSKRII